MKKILTVIAAVAAACSPQQENDLKLWYDEPAEHWVEALPVGNGRLGAMVFGGTAYERIQLNEETVWAGQPNSNANPGVAPGALDEIRKLIFAGKYREAQDMVDRKIFFPVNDMKFFYNFATLNTVSFHNFKLFFCKASWLV